MHYFSGKGCSEFLESMHYCIGILNDSSILFVRLYKTANEYIRVAVKISTYGNCYAKTLHLLSTSNAERYIKKGTLKKLDK